eukprot:3940481-Rhodomonas_salina.11
MPYGVLFLRACSGTNATHGSLTIVMSGVEPRACVCLLRYQTPLSAYAMSGTDTVDWYLPTRHPVLMYMYRATRVSGTELVYAATRTSRS